MNKYQEALDNLCNKMFCGVECVNSGVCSLLKPLQELVDKATPKKPSKRQETDVVIGEYTAYDCSVCKQEQIITFELEIVGFKAPYCRHCGQALDWSDEEK